MAAKKTAKKAAKVAESSPEKPAKKAAAKKTAKKAATKALKSDKPEKKFPPSPDLVARSAYLNYRRRVENGLPGDSHGDWLQAERQLREEV